VTALVPSIRRRIENDAARRCSASALAEIMTTISASGMEFCLLTPDKGVSSQPLHKIEDRQQLSDEVSRSYSIDGDRRAAG